MPADVRRQLGDKDVGYLVKSANSVRRLIRVKIADDNDLNTARDALATAARFFRRVTEEACASTFSSDSHSQPRHVCAAFATVAT